MLDPVQYEKLKSEKLKLLKRNALIIAHAQPVNHRKLNEVLDEMACIEADLNKEYFTVVKAEPVS